ncbi:acyltransferase family protein [Paenibacillus solanacearum]|uniref:acyltransferase family protein n=1 Tax=Paenibacillus solanacearum TaxID=2048548 RepID=UPI003CCE8C8A
MSLSITHIFRFETLTQESHSFHSSFWFMPLLFLLAGMSSFYALQRRTGAHFVKERFLRLLIPLVVGTLIIVPSQEISPTRRRKLPRIS